MTGEEHFRRLEDMYHGAPCNRYYTPRLEVSKGRAEVNLGVREDFFHSAGAVHGSVYFKALDGAAFFACNSLIRDHLLLTVNVTTHLIRPISTGNMRAVGEVAHRSRNFVVAESVLYNSKGRKIAQGTGTFVKSRIRLDTDIGYGKGPNPEAPETGS